MDASVLDAGQATRSWSLRSKLFIAAFAGTVAVLALIIGIVAWLSRNSALRSAEQLVQQTSQASAHQVETRLAASWSTAEALTQLSMSLHQSKIGREATSAATRALLEVNPQFVGLGSYWEPNAFDGRDADYVNKPGTDATGRYIEYQTRPDGVIKTVALVDYQKENADNQYYYRPMHTGKAWATEPYDYEITKGKHVLMMSMALPLLEQGKFLGAVTVDTPLDGIRNELANVKPYGGYVALLSTDGLYASHPEQKRLGQPAKELPEAARAAIAAGLPYQFERDGWGFRLEPVHLGRAPNPWALLVAYPQAAVLADLNQLIGWMVAVGMAGLVVLGIVLWPLVGGQIRPLAGLAHRIHAWSGELHLRLEHKSGDETGMIARAFNQLMHKLGELVSSIRQSSATLIEVANHLDETTRGVAGRSTEQCAATAEMANGVSQLTDSVVEVAARAQDVESLARETEENARHITTRMSETVAQIGQVDSTIREVTAIVHRLDDRSSQIAGIVAVISDIADQTNLLALNAAIEAARAGESGRGFAVVADEVRKLAERTRISTGEIAEVIQAIGGDIHNTVGTVETASEAMRNGVSRLHEVVEDASQVRQHTQDILARIVSVNQQVQTQSATGKQLSTAIDGVRAMADSNDQAIRLLLSKAQHLRSQAELLNGHMAQFSS